MLRRTKIIATMGPSSSSPQAIEALVLAGVDVVRINFSHGEESEHRQRVALIREFSEKHKRNVAILGDLQGPKIRISRFSKGPVDLVEGQQFILDSALGREDGTHQRVGIDYKELVGESEAKDILLLDDGRIILEVESVKGTEIHCTVLVGGTLSNNKGINRKGGGLSASALTVKDMQDIKIAASLEVDYLAVSFPRSAEDMELARELADAAGSKAGLIAKIERAETVVDDDVLNAIIRVSDGVMVARGDLGVEIGDAELIGVQKHIISRARKMNKVVITATQMMESMIDSPLPTRAEVFDVANAVLDGTDAVMLSAETAAGSYPIETVTAMARVIEGAEKHPQSKKSGHRINQEFTRVDESIALGSMYIANHLQGVKAIICITETGATPLVMSRIRSGIPIFAFTHSCQTKTRVSLYRGVYAVPFDITSLPNSEVNQSAVDQLEKIGVVKGGDLVVITKGDYVNILGGTNTMKVVKVSEEIK